MDETQVQDEIARPRPTTGAGSKRVYLETFGCQMNKLDSELALQALASAGYSPTDTMGEADLVLFNTCSVREHAEDKVDSRLGLLGIKKNRKPGAVVALMGCMAQREGRKLLARQPAVDLVVGTKEFLELPRLVEETRTSGKRRCADDLDREFTEYARDPRFRTDPHRAYVSIMRGCDLNCTYCIVPTTRGKEESRALAEIVRECRDLAQDGVKEVTLLGQTVNSWGKQLPGSPDLADLLAHLDEIPGLMRVRFITSHPNFFRNDFWKRVRGLRTFCPYIHVPAQHGNDRVLKRMHRLYTVERYLDMVAAAREAIPGIALASDWIVGFPGETEAEHEESLALLERVRFATSYVFKYSPRPGTPATRLEDDVPEAEKDRRCTRLVRAQEKISLELNKAAIGEELEVLVEGVSKKNETKLAGRSKDNRICVFTGSPELEGRLVRVKVRDATAHTLYCELATRGRMLPLIP
ncbi:MAG TPA: tRNA (N6-isopentenyl adenosine(37)-C2)-methylthiotransferase MiaB [Planctomycetota bacterium]|nr:tRNA (N6-isopentenyl adenosine(37)-C2)-methylthiotransferase MiaB [Planctomycetota bacterium]